jgi:hypothetical protein
MKNIKDLMFCFTILFFSSCSVNDGFVGFRQIVNVFPNPAQLYDTVTVAVREVEILPINIDSLKDIGVIIRNRIDYSQRTTGFVSIPNQPVGSFIKYPKQDSISANKFIQFVVNDNTISGGKVCVYLKNTIIESNIILKISQSQ